LTPDARQSWWTMHDSLPETTSLWLTHQKELSPIVTNLLDVLPLKVEDSSNQPISVHFNCGSITVRDIVPCAMNALHAAVLENWKALSTLPPGFWPDFDEQLGTSAAANAIAELDANDYFIDSILEFFPQACHSLDFEFSRDLNALIVVKISVPRTAADEVEGSIQRGKMLGEWFRGRTSFRAKLPGPDDMPPEDLHRWHEEYDRLGNTPSIWPQNRQCFLNIVEHLKKALPVKSLELDPRLVDDRART